ncbi:hypothetical protein PDE_02422 [Penicillium oxalicum 114-2]|uniref:Uncharacterized protein n=1 Tax=Penicillium oxalicum (strain 114-2 / CGMCC 5302) TaxID=933388 RepID=S7ZB61_PENO1|nr:hypothetical protein PDE_02422 [Penicillium oxalicum 114-2]
MRFLSTVLVAAGLATSAICAEMSMASSHTGPAISAAPSPVSKCASAKTDLTLLEQNQCAVALLPPGCNIQTCLNVGPTINCIIKALQTGSLINLAQCLTTGLQESSQWLVRRYSRHEGHRLFDSAFVYESIGNFSTPYVLGELDADGCPESWLYSYPDHVAGLSLENQIA